MSTPDLLHGLLTAPGTPGHEQAPAAVWREAAQEFADDVSLDPVGNSVARVNGGGGLFVAGRAGGGQQSVQ